MLRVSVRLREALFVEGDVFALDIFFHDLSRESSVRPACFAEIPYAPIGQNQPAGCQERTVYLFGADQASVTALSMMCRCARLHCGQLNVRKSWPPKLGSIAASFIGEPQAVHCGPWFCASSTCRSHQLGALSSPANHPAALDLKGSDATTFLTT